MRAAGDFVAALRARMPRLAGIALASTHLALLAPAFAEVAHDLPLFDATERVIHDVEEFTARGSGRTVLLATASAERPLVEFERALRAVGCDLTPLAVSFRGA